MRLNGWQRIGIVVSVVWAVGAAIYQRNADIERAERFVNWAYQVCTEAKSLKHESDFGDCSRELTKNWAIWLEGSWGNVALASLIPIPLGWLLVYVIIRIYRWVKTGFKRERPDRSPPTQSER